MNDTICIKVIERSFFLFSFFFFLERKGHFIITCILYLKEVGDIYALCNLWVPYYRQTQLVRAKSRLCLFQ